MSNNDSARSTPKPNTQAIQHLVTSNVKTNEKINGSPRNSNRKLFNDQAKTSTNVKPLLDCIQTDELLTSKNHERRNFQRRKRNKPNQRPNNSETRDDEEENSNKKNDFGRSTIDLCVPVAEHFVALRLASEKILNERILSAEIVKERMTIVNRFKDFLVNLRPDCEFQVYGSYLFECPLEKKTFVDVDIKFKEILEYDTLKELIDLVQKFDLCEEAKIDPEHKPSCINMIIKQANLGIRITSGYIRGCHLSHLIRIYTKFDRRVTPLLRLFRYFAKTCNIDKPDIGTLHPIVYHLMVIHFLQQIEPAVLPCLHEYVYGIDHVPLTLNNDQYDDFFRVAEDYSQTWKSTNSTSIEFLFLQLFSYYARTFNSKQFVVSIQTRMPVVKSEKNWHSKKLLIEDPTDVKRSLCQTMQSPRSMDYFREVFNAALNYFGRKQKQKTKKSNESKIIDVNDEDFIVVVNDEDLPKTEPKNSLHNSYRLFFKRLPANITRDLNIKQDRIRQHFKQIFDEKDQQLFKGILRFNSSNETFERFIDEEIQEALQHDLEPDFETMDENDDENNENHRHLLEDEQEETNSPPSTGHDERENPIATAEISPPVIETPLNVVSSATAENSPPSTGQDERENPIATAEISPPVIETPLNVVSSTTTENDVSPGDFFYDFNPENFHAEEGAPFVCLTCNGNGHLKSQCPELILPEMKNLPKPSEQWLKILTDLSRQILERFQPTPSDIQKRQEILDQLKKQFAKDCPNCNLQAFGSFYNGFGFRSSDLDVCFVANDQREQKNDEVVRILRKLLQSMRNSGLFDNVQPVLHAKVPIIRSRHRQTRIEIDISLHNTLAIENTRLLKTYTDIDSRVAELGYMVKHLAKICDIGDASRGTISSYAYIIMVIHFLQQVQPPVLPVLQQLSDNPQDKSSTHKKCAQWNVYFYDNLDKIRQIWQTKNELSSGALWIEFLRYYTEQFNYDEHIVCIRQIEPLLRQDKGWFRRSLAIEDPFELSHNLAGGLHMRNWTMIRRVFICARQQFGVQQENFNISSPDTKLIEETLFDVAVLCPQNAPKRCQWCDGPYHIRKYCPKFATLARDKYQDQRNYRNQQQYQEYYYNNQNGAPFYGNDHGGQYQRQQKFDRNFAGHYPATTFPPYVGQTMMIQSTGNTRTVFVPQRTHSGRPYDQRQGDSRRPPNDSIRRCFNCQSPDHIKAHCPNLRSDTNQRQKSTN